MHKALCFVSDEREREREREREQERSGEEERRGEGIIGIEASSTQRAGTRSLGWD
jgi:hypothetical protein